MLWLEERVYQSRPSDFKPLWSHYSRLLVIRCLWSGSWRELCFTVVQTTFCLLPQHLHQEPCGGWGATVCHSLPARRRGGGGVWFGSQVRRKHGRWETSGVKVNQRSNRLSVCQRGVTGAEKIKRWCLVHAVHVFKLKKQRRHLCIRCSFSYKRLIMSLAVHDQAF